MHHHFIIKILFVAMTSAVVVAVNHKSTNTVIPMGQSIKLTASLPTSPSSK